MLTLPSKEKIFVIKCQSNKPCRRHFLNTPDAKDEFTKIACICLPFHPSISRGRNIELHIDKHHYPWLNKRHNLKRLCYPPITARIERCCSKIEFDGDDITLASALWCAEEKTNWVWLSIMYFGAKTNVSLTARRAAGTRYVYGMFVPVYTGPDKRVFGYRLFFLCTNA